MGGEKSLLDMFWLNLREMGQETVGFFPLQQKNIQNSLCVLIEFQLYCSVLSQI